ncbi:MAG TPA: hypothetical protein P5270_01830 [Victivallales bacterium]|nr:hypothetical protein [Victivallales bacterium]HPO91082.1 hypothetical protein [Victivallales bacterium]HRR28078.1 hypothetical protein [Victivallales bacterium]
MKKLFNLFILFLLLTLIVSCSTDREAEKQKKIEEEEQLFSEINLNGRGRTTIDKTDKNTALEEEIVRSADLKSRDDVSDILFKKDSSEDKGIVRTMPFYRENLKTEDSEKIPISVNFDSAPIANVVRAFSTILKFDYIIDPQVSGNITISVSNSKMSKVEVWEMFEQILWLCGAYISPEGDILHIFPFAKMPQERKILVDHKPQPNIEVMMFPIRNAASKDILERLKPFLTAGSTAIDIPHQNSILLIETPANAEKIRTLVNMLDKKNKANWPQTLIRCTNVSSARIKTELLSILPILGFPVSSESNSQNQNAEPGAIQLTSLDRLQVILATAANSEALEEVKRWVAILDKSDVGEQEQVFIYKVMNGKADELLSAISVIFPTEGTTLSVSPSSSTSSTQQTNATTALSSALSGTGSTTPTTTTTSTIKSTTTQNSDKESGPASIFEVPVKVFADAVNNRLVIRTTPRTYTMLRAILERLDTVAAQVLLQVVVSEVTLSKDTEFGVEFSTSRAKGSYTSIFGSNLRDLNPSATNEYGMKYWVFKDSDPDNKFAYLRALAGNGKIKVLSAPQVVVKSHSEAKIAVGDKVPIVTSENTDTASSTVINRSIEYQDTGIILTITPHVTEGGLITMELEQTVSQAFQNNTSQIDSPIIQERVIKTALSVRDGGTIIVGGLIRERIEDTNTSYPLLQEIPLLRRLLGHNDISSSRTEMLVLITGKVINEYSRLEEISRRYRQSLMALKNLESKDEN